MLAVQNQFALGLVIEALVCTSLLHSLFHGLVLGYTLRAKSTLYGGTQKHLYGIVLVSIGHLYLVDWTERLDWDLKVSV